jgi:hypothetical protein
MALTQISTGGVKNDAVTAGKIPANAVGSSEIADDAVVQATIADDAVDEARLQISNAGSNGEFLQKQSGNTGGLTWAAVSSYTHPNHSGEVTSTADGAQVIADDVVDEANLKVSNAPTNGQFLSAQSGNTGGLTWATVSTSDATKMPLSGGAFTGAVTSNSTIGDSLGNLRSVPQKSLVNTGYTLTAADAGKHILTDTYVAIPNNVFSAGDVVTIVNNQGGGAISLTKSITNLYWTADGTDAARTLDSRGIATILFVSATAAYISGSRLS